jgi:hypothetical protein
MERAAPSERRHALRQCARDVAELWRMKRLASDADARLQFGSADDCPARLDFAHDVAEWAQ